MRGAGELGRGLGRGQEGVRRAGRMGTEVKGDE